MLTSDSHESSDKCQCQALTCFSKSGLNRKYIYRYIVFYLDLSQILTRLSTEIREAYSLKQPESSDSPAESVQNVVREWQALVTQLETQDKDLVIVVDGLNRIEATGRLGKVKHSTQAILFKNWAKIDSYSQSAFYEPLIPISKM